ncbi:putative membrane protein [Microbispora rosea]|uniref:Putative membrane protein n=1 Tax=Microbispora rosea TaxID=58117 RepID=A0A1N7B3W0_9ACTN|nr:PH domain-containing protein [Microbispora rosea]SIR45982.1 putative membrane protein [Microbispora rosea]
MTSTATPHRGRLSGRLIVVSLGVPAAPLALFLLSLLVAGGETNLQVLITLGSLFLTCLVVGGFGLARLLTTRYHLTGERLELSSGLLFRSRHAVPPARVRSVDVTANPLQRLLGLTTLRIDTGGQGGGGLKLDGLTAADAAELRRRILQWRETGHALNVTEDAGLICELDRAWLRYAPLTVWGVGGVLAAAGSVYRTLHEMKIDPLELGAVQDLVRRFGSVPLWYGLLLATLALIALGAACSTLTFIENWSGYELRRAEGGVLRVRRGLLATRSVSMEESRLRGVELVEPIPLRWAGGAKLNAVTSGLGDRDENRNRRALTPPVPRAEALRVAGQVLTEEWLLNRAGLTPHPRAALRRRINRALIAAVLVAAALAGLGLWLGQAFVTAGWITGVLLAPILTVFACDAHRTLGHGLRGHHLAMAYGTFARRTVVLRRDGIIGWMVTRSPFQRRTGLLTLGATTAAGDGVYKVRDVSVDQGLELAEAAVPRLLAPFVESVASNSPGRRMRAGAR